MQLLFLSWPLSFESVTRTLTNHRFKVTAAQWNSSSKPKSWNMNSIKLSICGNTENSEIQVAPEKRHQWSLPHYSAIAKYRKLVAASSLLSSQWLCTFRSSASRNEALAIARFHYHRTSLITGNTVRSKVVDFTESFTESCQKKTGIIRRKLPWTFHGFPSCESRFLGRLLRVPVAWFFWYSRPLLQRTQALLCAVFFLTTFAFYNW